MIKEVSTVFLIKLFTAVFALTFVMILANALPESEFGTFILIQTLVIVSAGVARLGLENQLVKLVNQQNNKFKYTIFKQVLCFATFSLTVVCGALVIFKSCFSYFFDATIEQFIFPYILLLVITQALQGINAAMLNALHKNTFSTLFSGLVTYFFALLCLSLSQPTSVEQCLNILLISNLISLFLGCFITWRSFGEKPLVHEGAFNILDHLKQNMHFFVIAMAATLSQQSASLVIAKYIGVNELAALAIALKIAVFFSYPLVAVNKVLAPRVAKLIANNNINAIRAESARARRLLILLATVGVIVVFFGADYLAYFFDDKYRQAALYLKILAIGQWFNLASGNVISILLMSGFEALHKKCTVIITGGFIASLFYFVPQYGAIAAVCAIASMVVIKNIVALILVYKKVYHYDLVT